MKVSELIAILQTFPPDYNVHLGVASSNEDGWEGDCVVRELAGVRVQAGYKAIALDAHPWGVWSTEEATE